MTHNECKSLQWNNTLIKRQEYRKLRKTLVAMMHDNFQVDLSKEDLETWVNHIKKYVKMGFDCSIYMTCVLVIRKYACDDGKIVKWCEKIRELFDDFDEDEISFSYLSYLEQLDYYRYEDTTPIHFEGDIIITDPCYITNDWGSYDYYTYPTAKSFLCHDTLYGDWSCTTYDLNTKKELGGFCADAGLVCVIALDDIYKHCPEYNLARELRLKNATLIKDFCGDVNCVIHDTETLYVVGHGVNIKTGEKIDFETRQTGF